MAQTKNIPLTILASFATSVPFGLWMENVFARIFTFLVTYYSFMFKYDDD